MIHIPSILFGQQERTLFTVNGEPAVWVQDVTIVGASHPKDIYLRYTTLNGQGMMSVYLDDGETIVADSDRTILCDSNGNPTEVTGIQRYFPPSVLAPAYLDVGERKWIRTEGLWAWWPSTVEEDGTVHENYPDAPLADNHRYRHDNAFYSDGKHLWWDEDFWYWVELIKNAPDGLGWAWKKEYSRGFLFDVADRTLLHFTDNLNGRVYERA